MQHDFAAATSTGGLTQLEVEVRSSVKHTLTAKKVREWLQRGVTTPKEAVLKERLAACIVSFVDLDGIRHSVEVS